MNADLRTGLFLAIASFGAGCAAPATTSTERIASFSPYANTKVGNVAIRDFLLSHYAVMITSDAITLTPSATNPSELAFDSPRRFSIGSAAAVDRRGYFLTAAHCLEGGRPYLAVFRPGAKTKVERPRVVWRGDGSKGEPDLAVLHVTFPLDRAFEWAPEFRTGDTVLAAGPNFDQPCEVKLDCFAGKIAELSKPAETVTRQIRIACIGPSHRGDSGGPLVNVDGRLLGINVEGRGDFVISRLAFKRYTYALRPDPAWLRQVIDQDFAARSAATQRVLAAGWAEGRQL